MGAVAGGGDAGRHRPGDAVLPGHEREASWSYLVAKRIALNDAFNRIVYGGDPERLPARVAQSGLLGLRCLQVDGRSLLFTTTLSDEELAPTFHGLRSCW